MQVLEGLTTPITPPKTHLWKALIGVGIAAAATVILLTKLITPSSSLLPYDNSAYGISIKYPKTWNLDPKQDPITGSVATFVSPEKGNSAISLENVSLIVDNLPGKNVTLDAYTHDIKGSNQDAVIVEEGKTNLANRPAYQIIYTKKDGGSTLKRLQVWTLKNNKAYVITYTADSDKYSKYLENAQEMISSFEIK